MDLENQYVIALAGICVLLLVLGIPLSLKVAAAPRRAIRIVLPLIAVVTATLFAVFDFVARTNVRG